MEQLLNLISLGMVINGSSTKLFAGVGLAVPRPKFSVAAYILPTSVPASEMEVVSNFNIGDRADQDLFDLPINNAGWVVNPSSSIIAVQEQVENRKIAVVNNSTTQTVTSISKTLTLGAGTYNLSFREFRQALSPYWAQLGSTEYPNTGTFSNSHSLILTISGSDISAGAGSETYEIFNIEDIEQAFTLSQACAVTITITSNTKNLAFEYLTLTKTVPAATQETNNWASNYRYGFNTQQKQDDIYGPGNQNTALYWEYDTRLGRRWNLDPVLFPHLSRYLTFENSPFMLNDILGDIAGDYYSAKDKKYLGNDGIDDGKVYEVEEPTESTQEGCTTLVGLTTEYSLEYKGKTTNKETNLTEGTLTLYQNLNTGKSYQRLKVKANSGGNMKSNKKGGSLENGPYMVDHYRNREKGGGDYSKGMNRFDVGFSFDVDPLFQTWRGDLRIHPDGRKKGTLGCIGIRDSKDILIQLRTAIFIALQFNCNGVPLTVNISNNLNNCIPHPDNNSGE